VGSIYSPTCAHNKAHFFSTLHQQIAHSDSPLIIRGDFNSKISPSNTIQDYKGGHNCTALTNFINKAPFPLFNIMQEANPDYNVHISPTYTTPGYQACIDHLLALFPNGFLQVTVHSLQEWINGV
jgi:hypothetical protein